MPTPTQFPNFPFNTYAQYKDDTSTFIGWLGQTARPCGFRYSAPKTSAEPTSILPLRYIAAAAQSVVDSKAQVPSDMLVVLRNVIQARERCARWYKSHRDMFVGDSTHEHTIRTFRNVFRILSAKNGGSSNVRAGSGSSIGLMKSPSGVDSVELLPRLERLKPSLDSIPINEPPKEPESVQQEGEDNPEFSSPEKPTVPEAPSQQVPTPPFIQTSEEVELTEQTLEIEDEDQEDVDVYFLEIHGNHILSL
ncbi:hypothetical protein IFR05_009296 [Cadophora sp. M221]|nr:hypothetical protein IFR05_009296 [Cadophora sp. M221]